MRPNSILPLLALLAFVSPLRAQEELKQRASWAPPTARQVHVQWEAWLADKKVDEATRKKLAPLWATVVGDGATPADGPAEAAPAGPETLELLCESFALVDKLAAEVVNVCRKERSSALPPTFAQLSGDKLAPLVRNNLRLLYGRWLAQNDLYDEALEQIGSLQPVDVVDPASLLFFQSVSHHRLLEKAKFETAMTRLMENEKLLPRRYQKLAELMAADIKPLKQDSLDEVSRMMDDIRRRLDLGRAGAKVRKEEDDVIAKLDKMIEEMEKQQQQQQQQGGGSGSGGSNSPSAPKQESSPGGVQGPGNVDPKNVGGKSGWGNLPPKDRQESLQNISKDLPAHFRDTIEEYFRKLSRDGDKK